MPASWEISEARKKRILLATIVSSDASLTYDQVQVSAKIELPPGSDRFKSEGLPWAAARNQSCKMALDGGYSYLAFIDSDIIPTNYRMFIDLMETGYPLISALYMQKFFPHYVAAFNAGTNEKGEFIRIPPENWRPGDIIPVDFVPAGALLIRRDVLELAWEKFAQRPFIWGVDTAPVPDGRGGITYGFSEDFVFSWRVKSELQIQPMLATGLVCLHEVRAVVAPKWFVPGPSPHPLHGGLSVRSDIPVRQE